MDFTKLANLQENIAAGVYPNGATLSCGRCGYTEQVSVAVLAVYFRRGWPKHCDGLTMICTALPAKP